MTLLRMRVIMMTLLMTEACVIRPDLRQHGSVRGSDNAGSSSSADGKPSETSSRSVSVRSAGSTDTVTNQKSFPSSTASIWLAMWTVTPLRSLGLQPEEVDED